jgi:acyl-CoA thioesterase
LGIVHGARSSPWRSRLCSGRYSREGAAVAIHCSISFLRRLQATLVAEAEEVSCGPKIAAYTIRVSDASGELIAIFEGMAYRKKEHW